MSKHVMVLLVVGLMGMLVLAGCQPTPATIKVYDAGSALQEDEDYMGAIQKYAAFAEENGDSALAPYALLNIARCHKGLGDKDAAMSAYEKVMNQYPDTSVADSAGAEMRELEKAEEAPVEVDEAPADAAAPVE